MIEGLVIAISMQLDAGIGGKAIAPALLQKFGSVGT